MVVFIYHYKHIEYLYTAQAQKVQKTVNRILTTPTVTQYLEGYQYENGILKFCQCRKVILNQLEVLTITSINTKTILGNVRISHYKTLAIKKKGTIIVLRQNRKDIIYMIIKVKINHNCDDELILLDLKNHLTKQGISDLFILDNKLMLRNTFFNSQSRMNAFAYMKEGYFYIYQNHKYKILYYKYNNFRFPIYLFFILLLLSLFWRIFRVFTLIFGIIILINNIVYYIRQKKIIKKKILIFMSSYTPSFLK